MPDPVSPGAALAALRKPSERRCAHCGAPFVGLGRRKYCSPRCSGTARKRAYRARLRAG